MYAQTRHLLRRLVAFYYVSKRATHSDFVIIPFLMAHGAKAAICSVQQINLLFPLLTCSYSSMYLSASNRLSDKSNILK